MTATDAATPDSVFLATVNQVLTEEGGYSNDPNDSGGETMFGITIAEARALGYHGAMRDLPRDTAIAFYRILDWQQPGFDLIAATNPELAGVMMDLGVNMGTHWPGIFLQRGLNVLSNNGKLYAKVGTDGQVGAVTRYALQSYMHARGAEGMRVLIALMHAFAAARYVDIAEENPKDDSFEYGWLANRAFPAGEA